jgi:hypothetical protein
VLARRVHGRCTGPRIRNRVVLSNILGQSSPTTDALG